MKKFDKILEFLFHTKTGICSLIVSVFASMFVLSGCLVADIAACYCDFFWCGMGFICHECGAECDEVFCGDDMSLYEPYDSYGSDCMPCACGEWTCMGGSSSSSSSSSSGCSSSSSNSNSIYVTIEFEDFGKVQRRFYTDNNIAKGDVVVDASQIPSAYSKYYTLTGYYNASGKQIIDASGAVVDDSAFKSKIDFTVRAVGDEKMFDEVVTVNFDTSSLGSGVALNPVKVYVGGVIDVFRSAPETNNSGKRFVGWRAKGGSSDISSKVIEGETVFHFYSFGATPAEEITLEPVYAFAD